MPLWARVAVPVVLVVGGAAAAVTVAGSQPEDPIGAAASVCREAVQAELESRGHPAIDVSRSFEVVAAGADAYRATGAATFEDADGTSHRADVRCTVRLEGGTMRATGLRIQD
ncbi:hypothetical protein [Agromyces bauzanensis]